MVVGFHHAALSTPDLDRCLAFYCDVLGCEVAWTFGWEAGSPQYVDCVRRATGRTGEEYAPESGPKREKQKGF